MDGITFGILYWTSAIMPFDLKHLPLEQVTPRPMPEGGMTQEIKSWKASPGEVVMTNRWAASGSTSRTVYKVDDTGRIHSIESVYADGKKAKSEYTYVSGLLSRIKHTYDGSPNGEDLFTWSDGKLATASYIHQATNDTDVYTFGWKDDRIDTVHTPASFPQGVTLKYTYPTADSVHMIMYRPSGAYATGYKLLNGHILYQNGFFNSQFKYEAMVGIRARMPIGVRPQGPMAEARDWLGRRRDSGIRP
jgi:hypothetical protein